MPWFCHSAGSGPWRPRLTLSEDLGVFWGFCGLSRPETLGPPLSPPTCRGRFALLFFIATPPPCPKPVVGDFFKILPSLPSFCFSDSARFLVYLFLLVRHPPRHHNRIPIIARFSFILIPIDFQSPPSPARTESLPKRLALSFPSLLNAL